MNKVSIIEYLYDDRWELFQVINGTPKEAIIHFFNMEYDYKDRPVKFRKGEDGWTYPVVVATCDPNAAESVLKAGSYNCENPDDERCRAREMNVWTPDLSPMEHDEDGHNACEHCGRSDDTWRNSSGELQCDNCGWSETE